MHTVVQQLDHRDETLILVAIIGFLGVFIVGVLNYFATRTSRNIAGQAAEKAAVAADRLDTGNDKDIGTTVHDIAQTLEIVQAQTHLNSKEIVAVAAKVDRHWDAVVPLVERLQQKEGLDG